MNKPKPSLLERAAEIYDFASGLPVDNVPLAAPSPRPRPRPIVQAREARPVEVESPVESVAAIEAPRPRFFAKKEPPAETVFSQAPSPSIRTVAAPVPHKKVELDHDTLAESGLLVPDRSGGSLAEEMRLIKRRLLSAIDARMERGDESSRLVLIASGKPGEGKTFVALNLALSIASERERRVLLVDGDNAKPEVLERLGLTEEASGLVEALADPAIDPESLVIDTDIEGLSLLPSGRRERKLPELLASVRARAVLDRLVAADPRHVGQALVVVKADTTNDSDLKETLDLLSPCEHLSLVLNSTAFQVGRRSYGNNEEYR